MLDVHRRPQQKSHLSGPLSPEPERHLRRHRRLSRRLWELIQLLLDHEVGVVQMPCPELCCLGLDRGDVHGADRPVVEENTRIRRAMEKDGPRQKREALADLVSEQVQEYRRHGFQVLGIVGANRSPNCGVETTSDFDREVEGRGAFMEAIAQRLEAAGISVPMLGLKSPDGAAQKVATLL